MQLNNHTCSSQQSDWLRVEIKGVVYSPYKANVVPTASSTLSELKETGNGIHSGVKNDEPAFEDNWIQISLDKRMVVMESQRLRKARVHTTEQTDETCYDSHDVESKDLTDNSSNCFLTTPLQEGKG